MRAREREQWPMILDALRRQSPQICRQWFKDLEPLGEAEGLYYVRVTHPTHQGYLERQCVGEFDDAIRGVTERLVSVSFLGPDDPQPAALSRPAPSAGKKKPHPDPEPRENNDSSPALNGYQADLPPIPSEQPHVGSTPRVAFHRPRRLEGSTHEGLPIDPDNSFENFVIGPENRYAHAAAQAVAEKPGIAYNPLFIHGGVGLGKTHLLQAICLTYFESDEDMRILYTSCGDFVEAYVEAVSEGEMHAFRHRYRDVDCLVIDDIHFLEKREKSQEEFFHTFNALHQAGKQIVLSSDAAPTDIPDLVPRLVSRFQSGVVAQVSPTLFETRVQIVRQKARIKGLDVPDEVASFIASRFERNVRELEGALTTVQALAQTDNAPITLEVAQQALGGHQAEVKPEPSINNIIDTVVAHYGVKITDLQSKRRQKSIAHPRQVCMYLVRRAKKLSLEEIGGYFGGRDHTTVLHAVKTIEERKAGDPEFARILASLSRRIGLEEEAGA